MLMLGLGFYLLPKDIFDRSYWRSYGSVAAAGAVMTAIALALSRLTPYAAAPLAIAGYLACLWFTGGLDRTQIALLSSVVRRKPLVPTL